MIRNRRRIRVNIGWGSASWQGWFSRVLVLPALLVVPGIGLHAESSAAVVFTQSAPAVAAYDFVEVTAKVTAPTVKNPFTDTSISGDFEPTGSTAPVAVEGFCDAADGSVYRVRFMPSKSGSYTYHVTFKADAVTQTYSGAFIAVDQHPRGPIRVDPAYPWHFIWEGTGEHYFFNGTTAYWLVGWRDDAVIQYSIDRLHRLKVNRMRVTIAGREAWSFFGEPVMIENNWTALSLRGQRKMRRILGIPVSITLGSIFLTGRSSREC